ncbi:MAG: sigma-54-dependent Fis family transcriptional regulator, partial [Rhodospirillales bacterium]|nr:sigma-54-dependent Fis family transcriptional regulator [Rhodospirillales bacterium]
MAGKGQVILIDDEDDVRISGSQTLELEGFDVIALGAAEDAMQHLTPDWPGVVVSDVRMPKMNGFDLLQHIQGVDRDLPVILITGHGDVAMAIKAIQGGAYDFVEKPAPPEYLIDVVRRALDKRSLVLENRALRDALQSPGGPHHRILGNAPVIERLRETIANIADTDVDVLLIGETGTGKELAARCLHDFSSRREGQFVALNCGAMPEQIIESELFGHEAGAFTGAARKRIGKIEYADKGTVFLDEIESMPLHIQVKLLRVLQERTIERLGGNAVIPVDIRVIAAAKIDLARACEEGGFREDLYYRLNVARIDLPALRDREADIVLLFHHFAAT